MAWRATKKRQEVQIDLLSAIFTASEATLKKSAETPTQVMLQKSSVRKS